MYKEAFIMQDCTTVWALNRNRKWMGKLRILSCPQNTSTCFDKKVTVMENKLKVGTHTPAPASQMRIMDVFMNTRLLFILLIDRRAEFRFTNVVYYIHFMLYVSHCTNNANMQNVKRREAESSKHERKRRFWCCPFVQIFDTIIFWFNSFLKWTWHTLHCCFIWQYPRMLIRYFAWEI